MFVKVNGIDAIDLSNAEALADLLFEVGRDLLRRRDYHRAVKWLEKSHDVLTAQEPDKLSQDTVELKFSVMHHLGEKKEGLLRI